jgi:hypothetical protein
VCVQSLWRFESLHSTNWGNIDTRTPKRSYFRFVNMGSEQGHVTPPFAFENELGCAYHEEGSQRVWAFGTFKGESTNGPGEITAFWSDDGMQTWDSKVVLVGNRTKLKTVWNTSVHKGPNGTYVMAIETQLYGSFTVNFATSTDLAGPWTVLDTARFVYGKGFYTGDPTVRYVNGWYFLMTSETHSDESVLEGASWKDHMVRSRDLEHWQESTCSKHNAKGGCPWLDYLQPGDKEIYNLGLPAEAVRVVAETDNRDNSDVDIVEYNNQTIIMYSWGDQLSMPHNEIAVAKYDGPVQEFLESWF